MSEAETAAFLEEPTDPVGEVSAIVPVLTRVTLGPSQLDRAEALQATSPTGSPTICKLGCLDADGHPYVVPVWFQAADAGFYIIARARSRWAVYLQRDGHVCLCIDDAAARRVLVKGQAEVVEEPNVGGRWVAICRDMAVRYMGEPGPAYVERTLNEPRWLFFVRPERITAWAGGWANHYKHSDW